MKAKHYDASPIAFIDKKFACQPLGQLPPLCRPKEPLLKTFIQLLTRVADRATTVDAVRRSLEAAVQDRLDGLTTGSCNHARVVLDDLKALIAAPD
jgi:hypothetical protein